MGKPSTLIKSSLSAMSDRLVWNCSRHAACRRNESLLRRLKERPLLNRKERSAA
jgi:hypothetical protein